MIGWYLIPYRHSGGPARDLPIDDQTAAILAADGFWGETEIDGDRALVRVRAPAALHKNLALSYRPVADPALVWTPTRRVPVARNGEVAFDSGERHPCKPLSTVERDCFDDMEWEDVRAEAGELMAAADRGKYVRLARMRWSRAAVLLAICGHHGYGLDRVSTGTFPTTGVLDNFNRGDENPAAGWSGATGINGPIKVVSNQAKGPASGDYYAYWNAATYGPDSEAFVTLVNGGGGDQAASVLLRVKEETSNSTWDGYQSRVEKAAGTDTVSLRRFDNGAGTQLGVGASQEIADGDKLGGEIVGSTLSAYAYTGGAWALVKSETDATYGLAGYLGIRAFQNAGEANILDDYGGGTLVPATTSLPSPRRTNILLRR